MSAVASRFIASANINPSVIVKEDPTANFHVLQAAAATDKPIGIAQEGTYYPPGTQGADGYAAHTGQPIAVYGEGEECLLYVGAAAITAGDHLKSDANGNAVTIAFTQPSTYTQGTGIWQVGIALESANPGEKARVQVLVQFLPGVSA